MIEPTQKDIDALALNWQSFEKMMSQVRASALSDTVKSKLIAKLRGIYRVDDMMIIMQSIAEENKISFQTLRERMRKHVPGQTEPGVGLVVLLLGIALGLLALSAPAYAIVGSWETGKTERLALAEYYKALDTLPPAEKAAALKEGPPVGPPKEEESWIDRLIGDVGKLIIIGGVVFLGGAYLLSRGKEQVGRARTEYIAWRTKRARRKAERAAIKFRQLKEEDEGEEYEPEGTYQ